MLIFWTVAAILTNYRLSRALAREDGPFDAFSELRERAGQRNWIGRGLHCALCLSFWLAVPLAWLVGFSNWREAVLLWGGIAGATVVVHLVLA